MAGLPLTTAGMCRQDTWSDLQLFGLVNLGVIFLFSWLKAHLVDVADSGRSADEMNKPFWTSLYEVSARAELLPVQLELWHVCKNGMQYLRQ